MPFMPSSFANYYTTTPHCLLLPYLEPEGVVQFCPLLLFLASLSCRATMATPPLSFLRFPLLILILVLYLFVLQEARSDPDLDALLAFKQSSDAARQLTSWNTSTAYCSWVGVSCLKTRVSRLVLENMDLQGSFQPLTALSRLRVLSLKRNRLSGPLPNLSNLTSLKLLFLSHNDLSGNFPTSLTSLSWLYRLDLSYNNLSGEIPPTVNLLTHLLTLRLEENRFSGTIPTLKLLYLQDFNASGNRLSGEIPRTLSAFPDTAFGQNLNLCGSPLQKCTSIVSEPTMPGAEGAIASPVTPPGNPTIVSSSPSSIPTVEPIKPASGSHNSSGKISPVALIAIIVGDVIVLGVVSLLLFCYFCKKSAGKVTGNRKGSKLLETTEKIVYSSSPYPAQSGTERGRMVFFEGVKRFELEDLLRASAEMLGKGGWGTSYKAILEDGNVVAVKRLKDAQVGGKREFEQQMEVLGRLRHGNIVSLRAFYFAREEKLLVYDYMPNGSLFWLLHGNRGPGRTPLDWTTRLRIAAGSARGLAFLHSSGHSQKLTHGNIKSSNVLLDDSGNARLADFGLSTFAAPPSGSSRSGGYRPPEASDGRKASQKWDVYSYGVLLLELLTGKCPSAVDAEVDLPRWVQSVVREEWTAEVFDLELMRYRDIEEEMVAVLQIALTCTAGSPEQRPKMNDVVKLIEEIGGIQDSPSQDGFESDSR